MVNADASRVAYVDLQDPGINLDLDTPSDLARAGLRLPSESMRCIRLKDEQVTQEPIEI